MSIKIKGTVGGVSIDLEIDGITEELISDIGQVFKKDDTCSVQKASATEAVVSDEERSTEDLTAQSTFGQASINDAFDYIRAKNEVASGELIDYLSGKGCSDSEIKRTMMMLRENPDIKTKQGSDFQRVYMMS